MTQGMAKRRKTASPPDEESWGGGQRFESQCQYLLFIPRMLNKDQSDLHSSFSFPYRGDDEHELNSSATIPTCT